MPPTQPPLRETLAEALGLEPSKAERALGYERPADMIFDVAERDEYWAVVTVDGRALRVPKDDAAGRHPLVARADQLLAAIAGLEAGNLDHWTTGPSRASPMSASSGR